MALTSIRKLKKLLSRYFDTHHWEVTDIWLSDRPKTVTVLFEVWTVESRWSPGGTRIYIGFENRDGIDETIGFSTERPQPRKKDDWIAKVYTVFGWEEDLPRFFELIAKTRETS